MADNSPESVLAIDFGEKRVGLAIASLVAGIPHPLITLESGPSLPGALKHVVESNNVMRLVVGYPRNLDGQSTQQTKVIEQFVSELRMRFTIPIDIQDEALSSQRAEDEFRRAMKPYSKEDIDALAAAYILYDWLEDNKFKQAR